MAPCYEVLPGQVSSQVRFSFAVKVRTVDDGLITNITGFVDPHLFVAFGLPPTWTDG
jgi:hypothetical protein